MRRAVLAIICLVALGACGSPQQAAGPPTATPVVYCSTKEGTKVYDLVGRYAQQWDDANALAQASSRMTMGPQVAELQKIRRDVQAQEYPECGKKAQSLLVGSMDTYINGYLSFLKQEPDSAVSNTLFMARSKQDDFVAALAELKGPLGSATPIASPKK